MLYTFEYNMYKNVIDYSFQWCTCCVVCHCLRVMLITGRQPPQTDEVIGVCLSLAGHTPGFGV